MTGSRRRANDVDAGEVALDRRARRRRTAAHPNGLVRLSARVTPDGRLRGCRTSRVDHPGPASVGAGAFWLIRTKTASFLGRRGQVLLDCHDQLVVTTALFVLAAAGRTAVVLETSARTTTAATRKRRNLHQGYALIQWLGNGVIWSPPPASERCTPSREHDSASATAASAALATLTGSDFCTPWVSAWKCSAGRRRAGRSGTGRASARRR